MNQAELDRILGLLGCFATWCYIFFATIPHATAGKYIASGIMFLVFLALLIRKQIKIPALTWLNGSVFLVIGLCLLSSSLTPYAAESLNQFRKDGLTFLLGFLLLVRVDARDRKNFGVITMLALILGFAVKELFAIFAGASNGMQFSIYAITGQRLPKYLDFFSADAPYYLPFLLGPICFWPIKSWLKVLFLIMAIAAITIVAVSGVRTAFILSAFIIIAILLYRFWVFKKIILWTFFVVLIFGAYLVDRNITSGSSLLRYASIFSSKTYEFGNDGSVTERYAIINGVWEVSTDRLLLGYGAGWKKLALVAENNGHLARWQSSSAEVDAVKLKYFSGGEGRVNPHNLYMTLVFECGLFGLAAYILLIIITLFGTLRVASNTNEPFQKGAAISGVLYLIVTLIGGMAGGTWLPINMLVTVVCLSLYWPKSFEGRSSKYACR